MKLNLLSQLDNPSLLEKLYREDKAAFKQEFNDLYPQLKGSPLAEFWNERLNYAGDRLVASSRTELTLVLAMVLIAGICAKLPEILGIDDDFFYSRNVGFLVFPFLTTYFAWKGKADRNKLGLIGGLMLLGVIFINLLPDAPTSDTLLLSNIHLVLFLWALTGFAFGNGPTRWLGNRLGYLRFNGDLIVMSGLLMISGFITTAITIGLFSIIGIEIEKFYFQYIIIFVLPSVPLVCSYLIQTIPQLVQKISPVIARIFSPLVLVMLLVYLAAFVFSGKDPYNDREFLLIFNALLVGVMALIFFSIAERSKASSNRYELMVLFLLSVVTVVVNGIALSAILFRISEWGITPNRLAVLGANVLMLTNLLMITGKLVKVLTRDTELAEVGQAISCFLPIYWLWTAVVTFLFPFIFGFA